MCGCGCLGKLLALGIGLLFIMALPAAVWWANLTPILYEEQTILERFDEQNFYENILPLVLPSLAESADETALMVGELRFVNVVENVKRQDWKAIAQEVVPPAYLQEQVEKNLPIFVEYLRGDRSRWDVQFDTYVLRDNLLGQPGDRMINRIFNSWENCTESEEAQLAQFIEGQPVEFPYCKPQNANLQREVFTKLNNAKDDLARDIPEYWNLREQVAEDRKVTLTEADELLYTEVQRPTVLNAELVPAYFLYTIALLALVVIFAVNSARSFFRWMGWLLTLGGIGALLPLGLVPLMLSAQLGNNQGAATTPIEAEAVRGVVLSLVSEFTRPILVQGAFIVALGFLLLFLSFLLPSSYEHRREVEPYTAPPPVPPPTPPHHPPVHPSESTVTVPLSQAAQPPDHPEP